MTALVAWIMLAGIMALPFLWFFVGREPKPKPTRCPECGGFKLPRAPHCFDCTTLVD